MYVQNIIYTICGNLHNCRRPKRNRYNRINTESTTQSSSQPKGSVSFAISFSGGRSTCSLCLNVS
eukprot:m.11304 g.11304  ORF g.11304 m.11304 type:complete len:65 (-) comp4421_c0_seq2:3495-3689(-)